MHNPTRFAAVSKDGLRRASGRDVVALLQIQGLQFLVESVPKYYEMKSLYNTALLGRILTSTPGIQLEILVRKIERNSERKRDS